MAPDVVAWLRAHARRVNPLADVLMRVATSKPKPPERSEPSQAEKWAAERSWDDLTVEEQQRILRSVEPDEAEE